MFGGLEIRTSGSGVENMSSMAGGDREEGAPASAPPVYSGAFSFMSSTPGGEADHTDNPGGLIPSPLNEDGPGSGDTLPPPVPYRSGAPLGDATDSSGFSFLNVAAAEDPVPAPTAAPSGFSFMMGGGESIPDPMPPPAEARGALDVVVDEAAVPPAPSQSGFSFMDQMAALDVPAPPVPDAAEPPSPESVTPVTVAAPITASASSAFSFMESSVVATDPSPPPPPPKSAFEFMGIVPSPDAAVVPMPAAAPASSGFGFLSDSGNNASLPPVQSLPTPPPRPVRAVSGTSLSSVISENSVTAAPTMKLSIPAPPNRVVKKKKRSKKVGAGGATSPPGPVKPSKLEISVPQAAPPAPSGPQSAPNRTSAAPVGRPPPTPTRRAATPPAPANAERARSVVEEATRVQAEADAFIERKLRDSSAPANAGAAAAAVVPVGPVDATVEAAQAAADMARELERCHKQHRKTQGGGMGLMSKLFRRGGSNISTPNSSIHGQVPSTPQNSSRNLVSVADSGTPGAPSPLRRAHSDMRGPPVAPPTPTRRLSESNVMKAGPAPEEANPLAPPPPPVQTMPTPAFIPPMPIPSPKKKPYGGPGDDAEDPAEIERHMRMVDESNAHNSRVHAAAVAAAAALEPPPAPPTPSAKLPAALRKFSGVAKEATSRVRNVRAECVELSSTRAAIEGRQAQSREKIRDLEARQSAAAAEEEFEAADAIGMKIEAAVVEREGAEKDLKEVEQAFFWLGHERNACRMAVLDGLKVVQNELMGLHKTVEGSAKAGSTESMLKFETESKRLSSESERLSNDLKTIEKDESNAAEEREDVEKTITENSLDFEKKKTAASEKLSEVRSEIEELRRQLALKEKEETSLLNKIIEQNQSMQNVRNKFSRQVTRAEKKLSSVSEHRAEWEAEHQALQKQTEFHQEEVKSHSEDLLKQEHLLDSVFKEISSAEKLQLLLSSEVESESRSQADLRCSSDEWVAAQAKAKESEKSVDDAKIALSVADAKMDSLSDEIRDIERRVPTLEAEKKKAAAAKNFRMAAQLSKQLKDFVARKEVCEVDWNGQSRKNVESAKEKLDQVMVTSQKVSAELSEKEISHGNACMERLAQRIIKIRSLRESLTKEFSDDEGIAAVGVEVLDEELVEMNREGDEYQAKFGTWNNFLKKVVIKDGEITTKAEEGCQRDDAMDTEEKALSESVSSPTEGVEKAHEKSTEKVQGCTEDSSSECATELKFLKESLLECQKNLDHAVEQEMYEEAADLDEELTTIRKKIDSLQVAAANEESSLSEEIPAAVDDTAECKNGTATNSCVDEEEGGDIVGVDSNKENVDDEDEATNPTPHDSDNDDCAEKAAVSDGCCGSGDVVENSGGAVECVNNAAEIVKTVEQ